MIDASSAFDLAADFDALGAGLPAAVGSRMAHFGALLQTAIASRAPGTNYPSTIRPEAISAGAVVGVAVGTDRLDGFRREIGFHGRDSLGRTYSQSGTPHFSTGFAAVAPDFEVAMDALLGEE